MTSLLNDLQALQLRRLLEAGLPLAARPYQVLAEIEADTGLVPLDLPMQQAFRIDLGFPLGDPS